MNLSELLRRLNNIVRFATVTESQSTNGKALARVKVGDRVSDFLPVMSFSNSFKKHWIPLLPEEQVLILSPFGEADSGIIIRGIFNKNAKEPTGSNSHTEIMEYSDGTRISYDTQAKAMSIHAVGTINITCIDAYITGNATIDGDLVVSGNITDSKGDVTGHTHSTTDGATALAR